MPSAAAIARSSGVVMKPRTRSALAPTYTVRTVTVALSSFGYCRTLSVRTAWRPAMMMSRLTTIARTGRRTKRSVNLIRSLVLGVRVEGRGAAHAVVHDHGRAVAQLERSRGHHRLARLDAVEDRDEVAARLPHPDE